MPITRWECDGSDPQTVDVQLSQYGRQNLVARPADWATAPEEATHHVTSIRERIPTGWYRADGNKMRCLAQEGEYLFRLDDIHEGCGLILEARPNATPDWSKAPADASHWGPQTGDAHYLEGWYKEAGNGFWLRASWETNEWIWVDWGLMNIERRAMLIERPWVAIDPAAPGTEKTVAVSMQGGKVVDWSEGPKGADAYREGKWWKGGLKWEGGEWVDQDIEHGDHSHDYPDTQYKPAPAWNGEGLPPIKTRCLVEPHNLQWGFCAHGEYKCMVVAYYGDFVWLELAELPENVVGSGQLLTRVDKVDFRPVRTPEQVRAKAREDFIRDAVFRTDASTSVDLRIALFGELFDLGYLYPGDEARTAIFDEDKAG